ncbi:MAG: hypothetical protein SO253_04665 [Bacilli bacterium]|nr:hypothetical protein [Bacilli bacterium]
MYLEIIAQRQFNYLYIILDCIFLVVFAFLLFKKRNYATLLVGFLAGILYMIVDYGIFHLLTHSRSISGGNMFWTLLWMSMSYGFTNFTWIWLWLKKDKYLLEYSLLILLWWFVCPLLASTFGENFNVITIQRTTGSYHGYMALILIVGYLGVIIFNLFKDKKEERVPLLWILAIGILVQFGWECALLLGGIRSALISSISQKLMTMVINSLLETNLGMPYMYFIYIAFSRFYQENLTKKERSLTLKDAMIYNNNLKVKEQ